VYDNVKRQRALNYGEHAWYQMLESGEYHDDDEPEGIFNSAAEYVAEYDQERVHVAMYWQDESVTIHNRMPNDIHDIFLRINGCLDCPVYAKGIRIAPVSLCQEHDMHVFTIWLKSEETNYQDGWMDPRGLFLKYANKDLHFVPPQGKAGAV
jgi:hypothetical protein